MRWIMNCVSVVLVVVAGAALADGKTALVGGRLIDGYGHAPIHDSVILVDGDTITAVGTVDTLDVPAEYAVISTEGMDVLPGLWEAHAHLMLSGHADYPHWQRAYIDRFADEIMPATASHLLLAGVTSARDLGAPLAASQSVKTRINNGEIPGPRLFMSGPFLQAEVDEWEKGYRWAVTSPGDARRKVARLDEAGMDIVKLIDQDKMPIDTARAIVDEAHKRGMKVIGHSHRPDEIRVGLEIGIDNFEHTGLTTAPEYPPDIMQALKERTATGRIAGGPLYWTPTVEGLWNFDRTVANPEKLDDACWERGLKPDTIADIRASIANPGQLGYTRLTPLRKPTLKRKIAQGKKADIIAVHGDVLEYINLLQNVDMVMKGGVVYKQGGQPVEEHL